MSKKILGLSQWKASFFTFSKTLSRLDILDKQIVSKFAVDDVILIDLHSFIQIWILISFFTIFIWMSSFNRWNQNYYIKWPRVKFIKTRSRYSKRYFKTNVPIKNHTQKTIRINNITHKTKQIKIWDWTCYNSTTDLLCKSSTAQRVFNTLMLFLTDINIFIIWPDFYK